MNNKVLMRVVHCSADLQEELQTSSKRKIVFFAIFSDGLTFNQLHHQVGNSLFGSASVKKPGKVGMVETSENLPFVLEACEHGTAVLACADELECDFLAVLVVGAEGAIHLSHSALADLFDYFVGANPASDPGGFAARENTSGLRQVFFAEKFIPEMLLGCDQGLDIASQRCVHSVGAIEIGGAVVGSQFQRSRQHLLDLLPPFRSHAPVPLSIA